MLKFYFLSIAIYYICLALMIFRIFAERKQMELPKTKESNFLYLRCVIISMIPIVNLIVSIYSVYYIISPFQKFKSFVEK